MHRLFDESTPDSLREERRDKTKSFSLPKVGNEGFEGSPFGSSAVEVRLAKPAPDGAPWQDWQVGDVVNLDGSESLVELYSDGRRIGRGRLVASGGNYAVRLLEVEVSS